MGDARALRAKLSATDLTAPTIQSSASAMMRFYESPAIAVTEWRNVLQSCQISQLLPLLYVANEVLQTSKRNRGNKFLEAFGPVLGASLRFICEKDPGSTEKVRRTAKIWGDRRVFSLRFVGDILSGLECYRSSGNTAVGTRAAFVSKSQPQSPEASKMESANNNNNNKTTTKKQTKGVSSAAPQATPTESDDSDDDLFGDTGVSAGHDGNDDDDDDQGGDDDDDDDDNFENSNKPSLLNVSNFSAAVQKGAESKKQAFGSKRRRSQEQKKSGSTSRKRMKSLKSVNTNRAKKRSQILSFSSFMERMQQLENLESQYQAICNVISSINSSEIMASSDRSDEIEEVGDDLIELYKGVKQHMGSVAQQRRMLHRIAENKREVEIDLRKYLVWLKGSLNTDEEELKLCDNLEEKLGLLQVVHSDAKAARDETRAKEAEEKAKAEEAARKKAEEEELKQSLEKIQKDKDPKEGMVWNKQLREYQYLADVTEESWRD